MLPARWLKIGLLCGWVLGGQAAEVDRLRLVPFPKEVRDLAGACSLRQPLVLEVADAGAHGLGRLLNEELERAGLPAVQVRRVQEPGPAFRLSAGGGAWAFPATPASRGPEAYALEVREHEVLCAAAEPAGLWHGLQTLRQLVRANLQGGALPGLSIRDWSSLRWRCFQDDMTRGPSSTLATLQFEASLGSYLKLNLMTYYMEYQYAFRKHPKIGPPDGSLTPADLSALVAYAKDFHVDILGNQQSFGHFAHILKHPEYAALRETGDVLTPVREETYQLLDDLYAEVCPLLPFPWFNVCCDETYGLGTGPSRPWAEEIGVGGVYVRHLRRVHDLLRDKHQKRMMMWGDIILQHPDHLAEVPRDTLMLTWGYEARPSFEDQILPFARSGYEFFVCPGVANWSRILPDFGVAVTNIQHFVRDGAQHGALGMINTDWEDDGEALNAVKWHADAWAAECAWNASATPFDAFNRRVGAVLFGETGDRFGQAVTLLARAHRLPGLNGLLNARFWERDFPPRTGAAATSATASNLLAVVRPALAHLRTAQAEARCNQRILDAFLFGARRLELIGQRMLDGLEAARLCEDLSAGAAPLERLDRIESILRTHRQAHEALGREFAALWLAESKPYALDWTLRRYTNTVAAFDATLARCAAARMDVRAGRAWPPAEDLGLALPKPRSRRLRPREVLPTALHPDVPWAEPRATHRLGLVIRAGDLDRFDLPVDVELALPADLASPAVRAFRLHDQGEPVAGLAQLDPLPQPGLRRLVLLLPGSLPRREAANVHVYLGPSVRASDSPAAVTTRPGENGTHTIENDRLRLLLGPEGAHVYRWEVKALGGRDLTMPGESGWAGFADLGSHRHPTYHLECTARGPALVEFQAIDPSGHTKVFRVCGGASWMEVMLSEPTSLYWDFDDPKNFAADGPTPGAWLFSNGQSGPVGRESEGVPAQVKAPQTLWGIKFNADRLALGLITPGAQATHHIAPGSSAGGVGIEGGPPAGHFVTWAGRLATTPAATMHQLQSTLDLKKPVEVDVCALQAR